MLPVSHWMVFCRCRKALWRLYTVSSELAGIIALTIIYFAVIFSHCKLGLRSVLSEVSSVWRCVQIFAACDQKQVLNTSTNQVIYLSNLSVLSIHCKLGLCSVVSSI